MSIKRQEQGAKSPTRRDLPKGYCRISWARENDPVRFTCWSNEVFGCSLHWVARQNYLCRADLGRACVLCTQGWSRRWYGWLWGIDHLDGMPILAQVPLESYHGAKSLHVGGLYGAKITLKRLATERRRVVVEVQRPSSTVLLGADMQLPDVGAILAARYDTIEAKCPPPSFGPQMSLDLDVN